MSRLALAALLAIALPAQAQVYKCVDERGVTHYSDKPRPGCKGGLVNIQGQPPISGQVESPSKPEPAREDAEFKRRQIERDTAEASSKAVKAASAQRCSQLRRELNLLTNAGRITKVNEKGERVFVDDSAREARIAKLREELRACP